MVVSCGYNSPWGGFWGSFRNFGPRVQVSKAYVSNKANLNVNRFFWQQCSTFDVHYHLITIRVNNGILDW